MNNFIPIAKQVGRMVKDKNIAYGDSFRRSGEILKVLYPNGVKPDQYEDMLGVVRIIDKLFRIANKDRTEDPWGDIAGYGILGMGRRGE